MQLVQLLALPSGGDSNYRDTAFAHNKWDINKKKKNDYFIATYSICKHQRICINHGIDQCQIGACVKLVFCSE